MNHVISETARVAHCVLRCKSLMSMKHPEMPELKRFSVCRRREMDDSSVDVKRHIYLRTIAKQKVYAEFDLATLSRKSAATHQHSFRV